MGMIENSMLIEYPVGKRLLECGCEGRCSCDDGEEISS